MQLLSKESAISGTHVELRAPAVGTSTNRSAAIAGTNGLNRPAGGAPVSRWWLKNTAAWSRGAASAARP
ncbi:hypothetical protein NDU88_004699 [Pleurodeles waltl]|uniref:Uncharacterized protein n=1 Tax=Pleurodeles waltl TaxID=8319 RepID=A0AAV7VHT1_PLEWA|nr:hypothetical protein NDU88_004699 [Pleurodeles waltl]